MPAKPERETGTSQNLKHLKINRASPRSQYLLTALLAPMSTTPTESPSISLDTASVGIKDEGVEVDEQECVLPEQPVLTASSAKLSHSKLHSLHSQKKKKKKKSKRLRKSRLTHCSTLEELLSQPAALSSPPFLRTTGFDRFHIQMSHPSFTLSSNFDEEEEFEDKGQTHHEDGDVKGENAQHSPSSPRSVKRTKLHTPLRPMQLPELFSPVRPGGFVPPSLSLLPTPPIVPITQIPPYCMQPYGMSAYPAANVLSRMPFDHPVPYLMHPNLAIYPPAMPMPALAATGMAPLSPYGSGSSSPYKAIPASPAQC